MNQALRSKAFDFLDMASKRLDEAEARERDITNPLDAPPNAPFSDSPPDMPKEPLWGGKAPVPIETL
jgi:hypothetical protein